MIFMCGSHTAPFALFSMWQPYQFGIRCAPDEIYLATNEKKIHFEMRAQAEKGGRAACVIAAGGHMDSSRLNRLNLFIAMRKKHTASHKKKKKTIKFNVHFALVWVLIRLYEMPLSSQRIMRFRKIRCNSFVTSLPISRHNKLRRSFRIFAIIASQTVRKDHMKMGSTKRQRSMIFRR